MTHGASSWLLVLAVGAAAACDVHELPVFELPGASGDAGAGGIASGPGEAGAGGAAGGTAGSAGAGTAAGAGGSPAHAGSGVGGSSGGSDPYAGGAAGVGGVAPTTSCASAADCMPGWLCEKASCDAPMGACAPPAPLFCPPEPQPVCGCDGVTYWNDCIRRQTGAQAATTGECSTTACACDVAEDCGVPGASCAHLLQGGSMCGGHGGPGACWVLPARCQPNAVDPPIWQECRPPDVPPGPCVDACWAIFSQRPHARKRPGESCR